LSERSFKELLQARWDEGKFVCVGLDSDAEKVKQLDTTFGLRGSDLYERIRSFNEAIVDATKDLVCAYKPNSAFYEALGVEGSWVLRDTIDYILASAPGVPVILDYKRGDIGSTNQGYVKAAEAADAVTLNPYLGVEAMRPFLDQADKGNIILCRTSNPGAGEFQDLMIETGMDAVRSIPLYQYVAHRVTKHWNYNGNCAVVVGATYPAELAQVRRIVGDMPILIPGIGAQGGELEATVKAGADSRKQGMIINSSRGIIFASNGEDFAEAARDATRKLHDDITAVLAAA
jgi:orotidine-5'-phosphate decarboxylase